MKTNNSKRHTAPYRRRILFHFKFKKSFENHRDDKNIEITTFKDLLLTMILCDAEVDFGVP